MTRRATDDDRGTDDRPWLEPVKKTGGRGSIVCADRDGLSLNILFLRGLQTLQTLQTLARGRPP